jgi:hypothetical protein
VSGLSIYDKPPEMSQQTRELILHTAALLAEVKAEEAKMRRELYERSWTDEE